MMQPNIKYAVYLLEKRDYSRRDLINKISEKYTPEQAEQAADYCEQHRYIDDERYALRLWERYSENYGKQRILKELYKRGIDRDLSRKVEEEMFDREQEEAKVLFLLRQKLKNRPIADKKEENKVSAFLSRKGFSFEAINRAIREYNENEERTDDE